MTNYTQNNEHIYAVDTMGLVLYIEKRRLPENVKTIFGKMEAGELGVTIPAIVTSEVMYLSEKGRIECQIADVKEYIDRIPKLTDYPLNYPVIAAAARITDIKELHDRLIAATAYYLNIPLITNDPVIAASRFVSTSW